MIFATFNGLALIHLYVAAPETKGKLLEEMDDVFDSRRHAWQRQPKGSRLDDLAKRIEEGVVKVPGPAYSGQPNMERRTSSTKSLRGREEVCYSTTKPESAKLTSCSGAVIHGLIDQAQQARSVRLWRHLR